MVKICNLPIADVRPQSPQESRKSFRYTRGDLEIEQFTLLAEENFHRGGLSVVHTQPIPNDLKKEPNGQYRAIECKRKRFAAWLLAGYQTLLWHRQSDPVASRCLCVHCGDLQFSVLA
jgi:hypothetical protein